MTYSLTVTGAVPPADEAALAHRLAEVIRDPANGCVIAHMTSANHGILDLRAGPLPDLDEHKLDDNGDQADAVEATP